MTDLRKNTGFVEISFSFHRYISPRFIHGAVTLKFEGDKPYSFTSMVEWPNNSNYESFVRAGVEQALAEKLGSLDTTEIHLVKIEIDEIESTPNGFKSAAYAATCAAFLV